MSHFPIIFLLLFMLPDDHRPQVRTTSAPLYKDYVMKIASLVARPPKESGHFLFVAQGAMKN